MRRYPLTNCAERLHFAATGDLIVAKSSHRIHQECPPCREQRSQSDRGGEESYGTQISHWIKTAHTEEYLAQDPGQCECYSQAHQQSHNNRQRELAHHERKNMRGLRAQGHPYRDFLGALRHRIRHQPYDAETCQKKRNQSQDTYG